MFASPGVAIEILFTLWCTLRNRTFLTFAEKNVSACFKSQILSFLQEIFFPVVAHGTLLCATTVLTVVARVKNTQFGQK